MHNTFYPLHTGINHATVFSPQHLTHIENQTKQLSKNLINIQEEDALLFHYNNGFYQGKHTFINLDKDKAVTLDRILQYAKTTRQINTPNIRRSIAQTITNLISDVYNKIGLQLVRTVNHRYQLETIAQNQDTVITQLLAKVHPEKQREFLDRYWELIKILDGSDESIREFERMSEEQKIDFTKKYQQQELL